MKEAVRFVTVHLSLGRHAANRPALPGVWKLWSSIEYYFFSLLLLLLSFFDL